MKRIVLLGTLLTCMFAQAEDAAGTPFAVCKDQRYSFTVYAGDPQRSTLERAIRLCDAHGGLLYTSAQ